MNTAGLTRSVLALLRAVRRDKARRQDGRKVLTPGIGMWIVALASWALGFFFLAGPLILLLVGDLESALTDPAFYGSVAMTLPFAAMFLAWPSRTVFRQVSFDDDAIYFAYPWAAGSQVSWRDVMEYWPNDWLGASIRTTDLRRFRLDELNDGFPELLEEIKSRRISGSEEVSA